MQGPGKIALLLSLFLLLGGCYQSPPIILETSPSSPAEIVVHVSGEVRNPGVYKLPGNSRVNDAIAAAGGPTSEADLDSINLAAFLEDGEKIILPKKVPLEVNSVLPESTVPEEEDFVDQTQRQTSSSEKSKININTCTQADLESLPGIGSVLAQRIIDYRKANGGFKDIEEIKEVSGIGDKKFEAIKDLITVK